MPLPITKLLEITNIIGKATPIEHLLSCNKGDNNINIYDVTNVEMVEDFTVILEDEEYLIDLDNI